MTFPAAVSATPSATHPIENTASGPNILFFWLKWGLLTAITFGIAQAWAKAAWIRFGAEHLRIAGHGLEFTGTGAEIFYNRMKAFGIMILLVAVLVVVSLVFGEASEILLPIVVYGLAIGIIPLAIVSGWKWRLSRTEWNNVRMRHVGQSMDFVKMWWKEALLVLLTLGFRTPYLLVRSRRMLVGGARVGNAKASFVGEESDFFAIWIRGFLLTIVTLGVYSFWARAQAIRWNWEHTRLGGAKFHATHEGKDLFFTSLKALVVTIFTFGIGAAWALAWLRDWELSNLSLDGSFDLARLDNHEDGEDGGLAEELAESLGSANGFDL